EKVRSHLGGQGAVEPNDAPGGKEAGAEQALLCGVGGALRIRGHLPFQARAQRSFSLVEGSHRSLEKKRAAALCCRSVKDPPPRPCGWRRWCPALGRWDP